MAMVPGMEEQPTSSVLSYLRAYTGAAATCTVPCAATVTCHLASGLGPWSVPKAAVSVLDTIHVTGYLHSLPFSSIVRPCLP